jgi:hypothetical protein
VSELEQELLRERKAAREYERWEKEQAARVADQERDRERKEDAGGVWDEDSQSWERDGRRGLDILPADEIRPDHEKLGDLPDEAVLRRRYLFGDRTDEVASEIKATDTRTIGDGPDKRNAMKVEQFGSGSYMRFSVPEEDR